MDHNFLEEKSKKWRLKNPQKIIPKLTYNVFFDSLIRFFIYPFLNFFPFLWKEIGLQNPRNFKELLKRARAGQAGPVFLASGPKKAKSRVGLTRLRPHPGPTPRRDRSR